MKKSPQLSVYTTLAMPIASTPEYIILFDIMICTAAGTPILQTVLHVIKGKQMNGSLQWAIFLLSENFESGWDLNNRNF